jgi:ribose-phosphate pyrophosphokinase
MNRELMIFSGNANPGLAQEICAYLGQKLGEATVSSFSDGEIRVKIEENVRGADVFVVQSCCQPVNDSLMELLIIIDALKRSSANRITAVIPYFGYARKDRKDETRVPISAKLVADLISTAGTDRVLTMDLHAGQIQGFSTCPWTTSTRSRYCWITLRKRNSTTSSWCRRMPAAWNGRGPSPNGFKPTSRSSTSGAKGRTEHRL